jgi:hypothetical protein
MTAADTCKLIHAHLKMKLGWKIFCRQKMTSEMETIVSLFTHIAHIGDEQKPKNQSKKPVLFEKSFFTAK